MSDHTLGTALRDTDQIKHTRLQARDLPESVCSYFSIERTISERKSDSEDKLDRLTHFLEGFFRLAD